LKTTPNCESSWRHRRSAPESSARFTLASDSQEALEHFTDVSVHTPRQIPDFILSDLSMPRVDDLQLLRELKRTSRTRDIPVAIITSSNRPNDRDDAAAAGCCAFFQKPVRIEEMITLVGSLPHICGRSAIVSTPAGSG
jgi:CheY-like chemotaxis protein